MEALLQQTDSLSNSERFDVNFVGQNLRHKNRGKKCDQLGRDHRCPDKVSFVCKCFTGFTW